MESLYLSAYCRSDRIVRLLMKVARWGKVVFSSRLFALYCLRTIVHALPDVARRDKSYFASSSFEVWTSLNENSYAPTCRAEDGKPARGSLRDLGTDLDPEQYEKSALEDDLSSAHCPLPQAHYLGRPIGDGLKKDSRKGDIHS